MLASCAAVVRPSSCSARRRGADVLAACSRARPRGGRPPASGHAVRPPRPPSVGAVPPGLERFYAQKLSWGPCASFAGRTTRTACFADERYDCARLEVPLDYAAPDGPHRPARRAAPARRAVTQIGVARGQPRRPGRVRDERGAVAVRQPARRGEGPLTAAVRRRRARPPRRRRQHAHDRLPHRRRVGGRARRPRRRPVPGRRRADRGRRTASTRSAARSGSASDVLANVGTRDAARDLDVLRAALGDQKLTYLGYSYGTRLGSTYAEDFPQNVRALVLDGALDPSQTTVERIRRAGRRASSRPSTRSRPSAPSSGDCPLGTDPAAGDRGVPGDHPPADRPARWPSAPRRSPTPTRSPASRRRSTCPSAWPALAQGISALANGDGTHPAAAGRPLPRPARATAPTATRSRRST